MLTLSGEVIGINTYRYSIISGADLGFAVSQRTLQDQLPKLKAGGDALDAVNPLTQWSYGPNASSARGEIVVHEFPWVLEWTLEEGGSRLRISARNVFQPQLSDWVDTTTPGTGRIVVYEAGQFVFRFEGTGKYTVVAMTK